MVGIDVAPNPFDLSNAQCVISLFFAPYGTIGPGRAPTNKVGRGVQMGLEAVGKAPRAMMPTNQQSFARWDNKGLKARTPLSWPNHWVMACDEKPNLSRLHLSLKALLVATNTQKTKTCPPGTRHGKGMLHVAELSLVPTSHTHTRTHASTHTHTHTRYVPQPFSLKAGWSSRCPP